MIVKGDVGTPVAELQSKLNKYFNKPVIKIDGEFGEQTDHYLKKFQAEKGLVADGIAGPLTLAALEAKDAPPVSVPVEQPSTGNWDRKADPFAFEYFKRHPGYGKDVTLPYQVMAFWEANLDTKEIPGSKNNPLIVWFFKKFTWLGEKYWNDETAHCKAGWNAACETAGFPVNDSALAKTGMQEGVPVALKDAMPGDTAICHHVDSNGNYNGRYHITFIHFVNIAEGYFLGKGSNQANRINTAKFSLKEIQPKGAIRRLVAKG